MWKYFLVPLALLIASCGGGSGDEDTSLMPPSGSTGVKGSWGADVGGSSANSTWDQIDWQ